jgi:hypothetical protein
MSSRNSRLTNNALIKTLPLNNGIQSSVNTPFNKASQNISVSNLMTSPENSKNANITNFVRTVSISRKNMNQKSPIEI